jgi:hypothetical protein
MVVHLVVFGSEIRNASWYGLFGSSISISHVQRHKHGTRHSFSYRVGKNIEVLRGIDDKHVTVKYVAEEEFNLT